MLVRLPAGQSCGRMTNRRTDSRSLASHRGAPRESPMADPNTETEVPHGEILPAGSTYIQERYLEDHGDKWMGPFAPNFAFACSGGTRSWYWKDELTNQTSAGRCEANGANILKFSLVQR